MKELFIPIGQTIPDNGNLPPGCTDSDPHFAEPLSAWSACNHCGMEFEQYVGVDEIRTLVDARSAVKHAMANHFKGCEGGDDNRERHAN